MAYPTDLTIGEASTKTQNFQAVYPNKTKGGKFLKNDILEILNQSGCVALRYYFSLDDQATPNQLHIVLVGVDGSGNDIAPTVYTNYKIKNGSTLCPPVCGSSNDLNHNP